MKPYVPSCEEEARYLAAYDPSKYKNPAVTADIALFGREEEALFLLLIRRGGYPYKGYFALPGGFIHISESVPAGAARELLEETGVQGVKSHFRVVLGGGGKGRGAASRRGRCRCGGMVPVFAIFLPGGKGKQAIPFHPLGQRNISYRAAGGVGEWHPAL